MIERDGLELLIPCHPADAVALAVRAGKPIMAQDSALAHALDAVQAWLDRVRPADFGDRPPR